VRLKDVSAPSVQSTKKRIRDPDKKRLSRRQQLQELVSREVRHLKNAAEHRGQLDALSRARELTEYVAMALAQTQPYNADGTRRKGKDNEEITREFWQWFGHMKDLLALRLPYERPRLASITMREERPEDKEEYVTVYELRARMVKKGIPVDHLIERPLILDHELTDAGARDSNGHTTNGR
jgi:hypothetical protein